MTPAVKAVLAALEDKPLKKYEKLVPKPLQVKYGMFGMIISHPEKKGYSAEIRNSDVNSESDFKRLLDKELKFLKPGKVEVGVYKHASDLNWDKHGDGY